MKAIILAGGLGSRLSEETVLRPKPMVEVVRGRQEAPISPGSTPSMEAIRSGL